ncbi:MAG: DUF5675 family protein, partial [Candidatus Saccharicenans sp.]
YRFLSPDPLIPTDRAIYNPQWWNMYGYCLNNPISYADPDGQETINILVLRLYYGPNSTRGLIFVNGEYIGVTLERPWKGAGVSRSFIPEGIYSLMAIFQAGIFVLKSNYYVWDDELNNNVFASIHLGSGLEENNIIDCILVGTGFWDETHLYGSKDVMGKLEQYYNDAMDKMKKAIEQASYATGTDMVLYSFDALDYLSAAFHSQELQINLIITSVYTIMSAVMRAVAFMI